MLVAPRASCRLEPCPKPHRTSPTPRIGPSASCWRWCCIWGVLIRSFIPFTAPRDLGCRVHGKGLWMLFIVLHFGCILSRPSRKLVIDGMSFGCGFWMFHSRFTDPSRLTRPRLRLTTSAVIHPSALILSQPSRHVRRSTAQVPRHGLDHQRPAGAGVVCGECVSGLLFLLQFQGILAAAFMARACGCFLYACMVAVGSADPR